MLISTALHNLERRFFLSWWPAVMAGILQAFETPSGREGWGNFPTRRAKVPAIVAVETLDDSAGKRYDSSIRRCASA